MADNIFSIKKNQLAPNEFDYNKLLPNNLIQKKPIINNIPQSINTSPVIQNANFSLLPIDNQSRPLKQPLGNLNINQLVPEEPESSTKDDSNFLASLISQSAAMLGAGIRGGNLSDVAQNFQEMRDRRERQKEQEDLAKKYTDPNSEESKKRRLVYKSALGIDIPENYSYTDLNDPIVLQTLKGQMEQSRLATMPKGGIGVGKPKEEKEKKNPFQKEINFINIYSKNGIQALDELKKLIQTKGTSELIGSSGTKMDQYIRDIAIAKTKILDPNSVISQGEIDSVKKTLGLDDYSRSFISNKSALESLDNFKNILINNRNNAINTLESLPSEESFNDKEKFIIESYRNNPDDPDTKRAYDNMLKSKGRYNAKT